eukprot:TRINITY_DN782133_c0_g1_i1.p1 TRINITY_DN782133_c0_g1~~TRINITY_DN782133_c0_g1_i1.p1  ORF type:complete len:315 (+),score=72.20 TRINITY_DN782133_c0_g1_i1:49-993(+)
MDKYANYAAILKYTLSQTTDGTGPSKFEAMSEEDRKWMEEAFESMMVDVVEILKEIIVVLKDEKSTEEQIIAALDNLLCHIDQFDDARNFCIVGGLEPIQNLMKNENSEIRHLCCDVISSLAQNHPECQQWTMDIDIYSTAMDMLDMESQKDKSKALLAVSAIVRENESAIQKFIGDNGIQKLVTFVTKENSISLLNKTLFFLRYFFYSVDVARAIAGKDFAERCSVLCTHDDLTVRENALGCLVEFCVDIKTAFECKSILNNDKFMDLIKLSIRKIQNGEEEERETKKDELQLWTKLMVISNSVLKMKIVNEA